MENTVAQSPILICGGVKQGDLTADSTYGRWPYGLCELVHRGDEPVNVEVWLAESEAALPRFPALGRLPTSYAPGSWESIAWGDFWEARVNRGAHLIALAGADPGRRPYLAAAESIFEGIIDSNPGVTPQVYKDLVIVIGRQGLETQADRARQIDALERYLKVAPADDPMLPGLQRELSRLGAP